MKTAHLAAALPALGLLWLLGAPAWFGLVFITEQYLAAILGLTVLVGLLMMPLPGRWRWPDGLFALASCAGWLWLAWNYESWLLTVTSRGPEKWLPAILAIAGAIEATRRHCGNVLAVLSLAFLAYGFFGWMAPGILEGAYLRPARYLLYIYNDSNGIPGLVLNVGATQILGFLIFGATLGAVGGSEALTRLALAAMGHRRGGPAKVAIIASSLFGTLSGSTVANVMSTGTVTIPMMKRSGFPARYAGAIEAVASNGGQIAPPVMGATAFVIAEFLQVGYVSVVTAALIPAALYYFLLYRQVDRYAAFNGIEGEPRASLPRLLPALAASWPLLAPLGVLIWFLFFLGYTPGKSALYSSFAAFALYLLIAPRGAERLRLIGTIFCRAGEMLVPVLLVCAVAGIIVGTINVTGLGFALTLALGRIAELGGLFALLLATAALAIVLGVGMPTTGVYVIVSVLLAPALVRAGVTEMSAHLFILYFGLLSMLTPPVAIASFAAASVAGANMWDTGITGLKLAITAYLLPFVFVMNPALLMDGTVTEIVVSCATILAAGHLLADVLASRRAYGSGAARLAVGAAAMGMGSITLILPPASPVAIALALAALPAAVFLSRLSGAQSPRLSRAQQGVGS